MGSRPAVFNVSGVTGMERKDFFRACGCLMLGATGMASAQPAPAMAQDDRAAQERDFIVGWLNDLLDTAERTLERDTLVKLMGGCGTGCFQRHKFKSDLAVAGKDDLDKLIKAYDQYFEIWREGDIIHIRYGETSKRCYCTVAQYRPAKKNDLHCECTRGTHQAVFEAALGRPFRVEIAESLRRGGKTCHFLVHLEM